MKRWFVAICLSISTSSCFAESVIIATTQPSANGNVTEGKGTAVCIHSNDRGSILLTCKHIVEDSPDSVWVRSGGDWHRCTTIAIHPSEDVAIVETSIKLKATPITDDAIDGSEVVVDGAGPALHRTNEDWYFHGTVRGNEIHNDAGLAVIEGDSGGPVYCKSSDGRYVVGGIAYGCTSTPGVRRSQHSDRAVTLYTPCRVFAGWIQTQCCPQGNCPIQIRPQVIQPVGPLGFPRGPARVIGIAEPVPQQYIPAPSNPVQPRPLPDPVTVRGPAGPQGPPGRDGRSVNQEEVQACVNAWLEANIDRIRISDSSPSEELTNINMRLKILEERPTRVIWADAKTKRILQEEMYEANKPIVLMMPQSIKDSN